jgi:ATP-dependent DNA ligase
MGSKRESVMLAYPIDEKRLAKLPEIVIFQRKFNGERCRVNWEDGKPILYSSCNNVMPFFKKVKEELLDNHLQGLNFDGELYRHGLSREEIHSIASRRVSIHPDEEQLSLHIFDIINTETQINRLSLIDSYLTFPGTNIVKVKSCWRKKESLLHFADLFVKEGYEGVILRDPSALYTPRKCNFMLKFKPTEKDIYPIVGWQEEIDKDGVPKDRLGSVLVKDSDGQVFSVGTGNALDAAGREYWWKPENTARLTKCFAHVKHSPILTVKGFPTCTSLLKIEIQESDK